MLEEQELVVFDPNNPMHILQWLDSQAMESQTFVNKIQACKDNEDDSPTIIEVMGLMLKNQIAIMKSMQGVYQAAHQNHPALRTENRIIRPA